MPGNGLVKRRFYTIEFTKDDDLDGKPSYQVLDNHKCEIAIL